MEQVNPHEDFFFKLFISARDHTYAIRKAFCRVTTLNELSFIKLKRLYSGGIGPDLFRVHFRQVWIQDEGYPGGFKRYVEYASYKAHIEPYHSWVGIAYADRVSWLGISLPPLEHHACDEEGIFR